MPQIKLNKHYVYCYIADHPEWFRRSGQEESVFRPRSYIDKQISTQLSSGDTFNLSGATLTAMVYDGVLEREFVESARCYRYRPILPINEEYKND